MRRLAAAVGGALFAPTCPCCLVEMGWGHHGVCEACWSELPAGGELSSCLQCGEPCGDGRCAGCRVREALGQGPPWSAVISLGDYDGRLRDMVHAFKFGDRPGLARPLGRRIARSLARRKLGGVAGRSILVPVPLGPVRRAARGYDQALLLARSVSRELRRMGWGRAPVARALRRVKEGPPQAGLGRRQRLTNPVGAFRITGHARMLKGVPVVLVDDVLTTGATARACIRALRSAGAGPVMVAVAGRTPERGSRRAGGPPGSTGGRVESD